MKKRITIVPSLPLAEKIKPTVQELLNNWVESLRGISPRIRIILPGDEKFDLNKWEEIVKAHVFDPHCSVEDIKDEKIVLHDWPKKEDIAFLMMWDSSLPGHKKEFLLRDSYLFCYGGIAFGLDYFEWVDETDEEYDLQGYPVEALSWKYILGLVLDRIKELEQESVPPSPKTIR